MACGHALRWMTALLLALAGAGSRAEEAGAVRIVPIEAEPGHHLRFENAHVRFFDVELAPGYQSLWHSHLRDGVFVNIAAAPTRAQDLGLAAADRPPRTPGETYFIDYATRPKVHRVANTGDSPYRVTDTEIVGRCATAAMLPPASADTLVDNRSVRVTRVRLAPGEQRELAPGCALLVAVGAGSLELSLSHAREDLQLEPAGFRWREDAASQTLRNRGDQPFEGVDIVIK